MSGKENSDSPDSEAIQAALSRLARRNYGEEGIPMLVILQDLAGAASSRPMEAQDVGRGIFSDTAAEREAAAIGEAVLRSATSLAGAGRKLEMGDLARIIEWIADERFGPDKLAAGRGLPHG